MIGKNRGRWQCRPCGKVSYGSHARALETIAHFSGAGDHVPRRAYECPYENGWHLSSQEVWV